MSASTPEGKVKAVVSSILKEYGAYYFMPVQMGMGSAGMDYHCIFQGFGFCIETKAPGKKPTPRQVTTMDTIEKAGGITLVIDGATGFSQLRMLLESIKHANPRFRKTPEGGFTV